MAKEAEFRDVHPHDIYNFEPQNESALEKGTILQLVDGRKVSGTQVSGMMIAGICAREKTLDDGEKVAVYVRGIFDMVCSGAVALGETVGMATEENHVVANGGADKMALSGMAVLGKSLETGTSNETIQVFVNVGGGV